MPPQKRGEGGGNSRNEIPLSSSERDKPSQFFCEYSNTKELKSFSLYAK